MAGHKANARAPLFERCDQFWQKGRIVLAVAVKRRHDRATRGAYTASYRGRLPRGDGVAKLPQVLALLHDGRDALGGGISRAIIDIDDFVDPTTIERRCDLLDQGRDVLRFIADGNDNGDRDVWFGERQIGARRVGSPLVVKAFLASASYGAGTPRATL